MKFYLAQRPDQPPLLLTRKDEALKVDKDAEQFDVPVDQEGLRKTFQDSLNRIWELEQAKVIHSAPLQIQIEAPKTEGYVERANRFEDEFDKFPLSLQLHYAATACENARHHLPNIKPGTPVEKLS